MAGSYRQKTMSPPHRDLSALTAQPYDVIVVGAGIYGSVVTLKLAEAGLRTLAMDQGDFCSATSANSLKILHGGLRYLQHLNIKRMRETITSRRHLMRFSPHLVRPLACMIPTAGHGFRSRPIMRVASMLNNLISADRNRELPPSIHLPGGGTVERRELLAQIPSCPEQDPSGGVVWHDGLAVNSERLALEHLLLARDLGATLCNYLRADRVTVADNRVTGVEVTDLVGGGSDQVRARWVINAAGPWFDDLLARSGIAAPPTRWAKAVNVVVRKQLNERFAVGIEGQAGYQDQDAVVKRGKRFFFFVPWQGGTMIGTTYHAWTGDKDTLRCDRADIEEILSEVNAIYPAWGLRAEDVTFFHVGLLPMADGCDEAADTVQLAKHSLLVDHGATGGPTGLVSLRSIKYTTAPAEADKVARLIAGGSASRKRMPSAEPEASPALTPERANLMPMLVQRYGRWAGRVLHHLDGDDPAAWWLHRQPDLLVAEVRYFLVEEMAQILSDVVFRRADLGAFARPSTELLTRIAGVMAEELGWDPERQAREVEQVEAVYAPLPSQQVHTPVGDTHP